MGDEASRDATLDLLSELLRVNRYAVELEQERNRLDAERLAVDADTLAARQRHNDLLKQITAQAEINGEFIQKLNGQLPQLLITVHTLDEWMDWLAERVESLHIKLDADSKVVSFLLSRQPESSEKRQYQAEMSKTLHMGDSKKTRLLILQNTLNHLLDQEAKYGINIPVDLIVSIGEIRQKIAELDETR